jgi:dTDP-4-amino-4,6-dideoxygalactose transaminase
MNKNIKIELIDLKTRFKEEKKELMSCVERVLKKGHLILTSELKEFENQICKYTKRNFCLGLNSGTDALMMSLWALGIGKGDEVITTPISFVASIGAIVHVGAKPVFVDAGIDLNINPTLIEKAITKRTKAIMPVHWGGRVCQMDIIMKIAKKYNLFIIEDAAQAMGAFFNNKHAGNFSDIAAFSSHPLKNLNAVGDGGFIVTNNKKLYDKIALYRNHGLKSRDNVEIFGVNSRLDVLNAEILKFRLKKLKNIILRRSKNVSIYKKYIQTNKVILPIEDSSITHSYVMLLALCENRDELQKYLQKKGIQTLIYYGTPLHLHKASKILNYKRGDFPNAELLCSKVLALPHHQNLKFNEIVYVSQEINKFYNNY